MRTVIIFVFIASFSFAAFAADEPVVFDVKKYPDKEKELKDLSAGIPGICANAYKEITAVLGPDYSDQTGIRLLFTDEKNEEYGKDCDSHSIVVTKENTQIIVFFVEHYFAGEYSLQKKITHELVHAVMRKKLNEEKYSALPKWFREGAALYIAGQGDDRIKFLCSVYVYNLPAMVKGLSKTTGGFGEYAEFYLAFKYIESKFGAESIGKFINSVIKSEGDYKSALKDVCGLEWTEFEKQAEKYSRAEIKDITGKELPKWEKAYELFSKGKFDKAGDKFKDLMDKFPRSWIYGKAMYYYGRCLQEQLMFDEAAVVYADLIELYPQTTGLIDDARLALGVCEYSSGLYLAAINTLRDYIRHYPGKKDYAVAWYHIGISYLKLDKKEEGRQFLRNVINKAPKSDIAPEAKKILDNLGD